MLSSESASIGQKVLDSLWKKYTNPIIDYFSNHRRIDPSGKVEIAEPGLHGECNVVEPVKEFILLPAGG
jgi:hypothetical protein